jgi:hypothetical protein
MGARFRNPQNGYEEEVSPLAWLWVFLFGGFYFAVKGVWTHFFAGFVLAVCTLSFSWWIYPFFAGSIMRTHYRRMGWREVRGSSGGYNGGYDDRQESPRVSRGPQDDFNFR